MGAPMATLDLVSIAKEYLRAVEEGATLVRLGTVLFGARSA